MTPPLIVGVCGGSGSGKTTFARALAEASGPAVVLAEDDYYVCRTRTPDFDADTRDFDHPSAKELDLLRVHLGELRAGRAVMRPVYDLKTHSRTGEARVEPAPLVIVEGLHFLSDPELCAAVDHAFFVDAPDATRFERRLARDVAARARTAESVRAQWDGTVQPAFLRWIAPFAERAHTRVDGTAELAAEVARAVGLLAARRSAASP